MREAADLMCFCWPKCTSTVALRHMSVECERPAGKIVSMILAALRNIIHMHEDLFCSRRRQRH